MPEQSATNATPNSGAVPRLSRSGNSLYNLLDLEKGATEKDIKKSYRLKALRLHPDKNPNNPEAEEQFKKVNYAHRILTDEKKRQIYDLHGSFGLQLTEQLGDDVVELFTLVSNKWFQCAFWVSALLTGCFCCCCCLCCCNCCCGKCKVAAPECDTPDLADFEAAEEGAASTSEPVVVVEPPAPTASTIASETTALNPKENSTSYVGNSETKSTDETETDK